ncbi:MAG: histidine ammonia-lyase [Gammaproteobacteria bacterium]|nr:histidine ammonia-lyase [Gammaproteobacteria bacterium]
MTKGQLILDGRSLTLQQVADFQSHRPECRLGDEARKQMAKSVATVNEVLASGKICYGINTGFGAFANKQISAEQTIALQYNLVRSHCAGTGEPLPDDIVRRTMLLKANSLAIGFSGIRDQVVDTLLALLNADILPVIPAQGSVGASGDLAPLAHMALALIGEGEARQDGRLLEGKAVLEAAGCQPVTLQAKEGLALLNGTQVSAALAMEGLFRADRLLKTALVSGAFSVEGLAGSHSPFDERIHKVRNLDGQQRMANGIRSLLGASEIKDSHADCDRVQDPYSIRCMPQVMGAVADTLAHASHTLANECNSVSDNPLIFDDEVLSGGNFHAEPIAFVSDFMAIALTEMGTISERRIDLLLRNVNPKLSMFLTSEPGLESGFMIAHVTAAALASENKTLAHPASTDSIPTSAGQEDHVSMAPWAGRKLLAISDNLAGILAIELLAATAALDQLRPLKTTAALEKVHAAVRELVPASTVDRRLDKDISKITDAILSGQIAALLPAQISSFFAGP